MAIVHNFNCEDWEKEVTASEAPVLVDFRIPRQEASSIQNWALEKFSADFENAVKVGFLDVSKCLEIAFAHRVQDLPTLGLFQGGKLLKSFTGYERVGLMEAWWISRFAKDFRPSGFFRLVP